MWCSIRIEQESGSSVDQGSKSLESFVDLTASAPEMEEVEKTETKTEERRSVIPALKVQNGLSCRNLK